MQQSATNLVQPPRSQTVLLVDDDPEWLHETSCMLLARGLQTVGAADSDTFENLLRGPVNIGVLLVDLYLGENHGPSVVKRFKEEGLINDHTQLLFVGGAASRDDLLGAIRCGALDFLQKPVAPMTLVTMVEYALQIANAATPVNSLDGHSLDKLNFALEAVKFLKQYSNLREEYFSQITDRLSWQLCLEAYRCSLHGRHGSLRTASLSLGQPYERCVRAMARLRRMGLVQTTTDQFDGRRLLFTISELGERQFQSLLQEMRCSVRRLS